MTDVRDGVEATITRLAEHANTRQAVAFAATPPTLESFAERLYESLAPLAWLDATVDYALAKYNGAVGVMFQAVEDLARDTPEGPGWSAVMDLDRCPTEWLPWLAQFAGVTVPAGYSDADARAWINSTDGFNRGTPAAIRKATQAHLTGTKTVLLQERLGGDPYALGVYTLNTETPDVNVTRADILGQKPGGIVLTYNTGPPNTYNALSTGYATYDAVNAAFPDYLHLAAGQVS